MASLNNDAKLNTAMIYRCELKMCWLFFVVMIFISCSKETTVIYLQVNNDEAPVRHGVAQLKKLSESGIGQFGSDDPDYIIQTNIDSVNLHAEAFEILINNKNVELTGGDAVGLMYALLDVKEQLQTDNKIIEKNESPALDFRALKFNLPWDAYRSSETLRQHTETCKDTLFWKDFLDMMAENRFNKLTLWNLHPFNFMVKTEKYPEACNFSDEELVQWQQFWHTLFRMAKDRGIETYLINWNIFVPKEFAVKHGVAKHFFDTRRSSGEDGDTSEIIKDYMRESVRATIDTYPNLTGLGVTLGEAMGGMTAEQREQWLLDSFIEGARQAKRKIKFIHRVPLSAGKGSGGSTSASVEQMTRSTLDTLTCFDGPINIELKFNWSHAHSTTKLVKVHGGKLTDTYWNPLPKNYHLAWMMRNEDFFILRWGQPDFIREHIKENVHPYVNGYYVGSETYIPAKDYITSLPGASYKYAFERQWMFYKTWGRLLYNPKTPDSFFVDAFENKFPTHGQQLFDGLTKASRIPLIIASYWNATWDLTLYSEGMIGFNEGPPAVKLLSLATLCNKEPMDPSYISVKEYLQNEKNSDGARITPIALADSIDSFCVKALHDVEKIDAEKNIDLLYEVSDIQAWSYLGMYFSNKLRAAVAYQKFLDTADQENLDQSIVWLEKATDNWKELVRVTTPVYKPVPIEHKGYKGADNLFHWSIVKQEVEAELVWLKNQRK